MTDPEKVYVPVDELLSEVGPFVVVPRAPKSPRATDASCLPSRPSPALPQDPSRSLRRMSVTLLQSSQPSAMSLLCLADSLRPFASTLQPKRLSRSITANLAPRPIPSTSPLPMPKETVSSIPLSPPSLSAFAPLTTSPLFSSKSLLLHRLQLRRLRHRRHPLRMRLHSPKPRSRIHSRRGPP